MHLLRIDPDEGACSAMRFKALGQLGGLVMEVRWRTVSGMQVLEFPLIATLIGPCIVVEFVHVCDGCQFWPRKMCKVREKETVDYYTQRV